MMIHLIDNDTKETFKSFGDNEVQPAIAAARASGKIRPFLDAVGEMAAFGEIRTPEEIKKEIKHTKNPMRLSQLYKELDASYKEFKKLKGRSNGE